MQFAVRETRDREFAMREMRDGVCSARKEGQSLRFKNCVERTNELCAHMRKIELRKKPVWGCCCQTFADV